MATYRRRSSAESDVALAGALGFLAMVLGGFVIVAVLSILQYALGAILAAFMLMGRGAPNVGKTLYGTFVRTAILALLLTGLLYAGAVAGRLFHPALIVQLQELGGLQPDWDWADERNRALYAQGIDAIALELAPDAGDYFSRLFPSLLIVGYIGMLPGLNWWARVLINTSGGVAVYALHDVYVPCMRASLESRLALVPGTLSPQGTVDGTGHCGPGIWSFEHARSVVVQGFEAKWETLRQAVANPPRAVETPAQYLIAILRETEGNVFYAGRMFDLFYFVATLVTGAGTLLSIPWTLASIGRSSKDG